ncbi:MAG: hypothetical protein HZB10_02540 [Candidatus Yonathbacteria bacterium]|nr:hypothetical protein [Candidatus Yonathbacteria bacterium]
MAVRMVLNQEEMGEIALKYVQRKILSETVPMNADKIRREIGNTAKELGIPPEKAMQFVVQILSPAFEKVLVDLSK